MVQLETVIYGKKDEIAIISLNRPKVLNAQNRQLISDFLEALKMAQADAEVKVVIIKGEGRAFSSGEDLSQEPHKTLEEGLKAIETMQDTTRTILRMGKPVIAAVHGYAIGGGADWAMNSDIRIAAEGTKFGFPEMSVGGFFTNAESKLLPLLIGLGRAKELVFTNGMIDAKQAEQYGLVNKVVPLENLDKAAMDMAKDIAKNPPLPISLSKKAMNQGAFQDLEQTLEQEVRDAMIILSTGESAELSKAALEKTKK